jgi:hypothetical protein
MKLPQVLADPASSGRRAAPRDFGGGEGMAAMGQAVSGLGDIAGKLFEEEMSAQVSGSLADATRSLNDLGMEVQANPDHNTRNKLYAEGAQKIASDFRKGLKYPRFQGMFDERLEGTLESGRLGVKQGVEKAQIDSAKANRLLFIESKTDALENISDPTARVQAMNEIREEFAAGVRGGLWNAGQAAAMQIKLENRIAGHELITESQAAADDIMDTYPTAEQRLDAALGMAAGPLRDAVVSRVESRQSAEDGLYAKAAKAQHTALLHRAYSDLTQEQLLEESIALSAKGTPLDPAVLKSVASVIAYRVSSEGGLPDQGPLNPHTNYSKLLDMARDPVTRQEFLGLDLSKYAGGLLPAQYDKLVTNQEKGAWGLTSDTTKRVDRALAKLSLPVTNAGIAAESNATKVASAEQFRAVVENAVMQEEHRTGNPLSGKATQDIINALSDEVVIDVDMAWDDTVPIYQITPETEIGDVPHSFAAKARERAIPKVLTDEDVRKKYLDMLLIRQAGGTQ